MELKEAYIDEIICHHFSVDPSLSLINNACISMAQFDTNLLKDFFVKPFTNVRSEYGFSHPVDLSFNIVYQTMLKMLQDDNFVKCSQDIFRHLQSVSALPSIKDGDVFVAKISDIMIDTSYFEGIGIYKIERKSEFIETFTDEKGNMQFAIKNGFTTNRIDKACLVVFTDKMPRCYLIDASKDTKFWRQDFLGVITMPNAYSKSKTAIDIFHSFVKEELSQNSHVTKEEQISLLNIWAEKVKESDRVQIKQMAESILPSEEMKDMFFDYCKAFEEKDGFRLSDTFDVDKKAISLSKKVRTIKLDDTVEIHLMKTGNFIERGFDDSRGMNYYKLYFSKEK